jgi:hypothetical protein
MLKIEQAPDGSWQVTRDGKIIADGLSNAAAWRVADKLDTDAADMGATSAGSEWLSGNGEKRRSGPR